MSSTKGLRAILVFAKAPRPGRAKTRLAATVGDQRAAELAAAFLDDTLRHAARAAVLAGAGLEVHHDPPDARASFEERLARLHVAAVLVSQAGTTLGERLEAGCRRPSGVVLALGTDTPDLDAEELARAFPLAEERGAVLGPARDGGYWAVALRAGLERAFLDPIRWSTGSALEDTRGALARRGVVPAELETREDVDDAAGLARLEARLVRDPGRAPATASVLGLGRPLA